MLIEFLMDASGFLAPRNFSYRQPHSVPSVKAGLLTSFPSQAPSHPKLKNGQWINMLKTCLRELTAAGQSGISTPFPFNRCYTNLDGCKFKGKKLKSQHTSKGKTPLLTVFKAAPTVGGRLGCFVGELIGRNVCANVLELWHCIAVKKAC